MKVISPVKVQHDWQEFGGNIKAKLEKEIFEKYRLFTIRLFKPKEVILEVIPLLIASSLFMIWKEYIQDSFEELYGMVDHKKDHVLFLYQFVI